ncbi:hypothetical protein BE221DRAFT_73839 [Ostreococcus tauri]|uniref:Uncharacterized protein n=1 Tax=Ostreococcus tauri TaxID=70448 RepID=A0A1Y5IAW3_OSTTA|nr:hypothetical protein BE221DRAFT_73839 [Ostreococcus tauri]
MNFQYRYTSSSPPRPPSTRPIPLLLLDVDARFSSRRLPPRRRRRVRPSTPVRHEPPPTEPSIPQNNSPKHSDSSRRYPPASTVPSKPRRSNTVRNARAQHGHFVDAPGAVKLAQRTRQDAQKTWRHAGARATSSGAGVVRHIAHSIASASAMGEGVARWRVTGAGDAGYQRSDFYIEYFILRICTDCPMV